MTRRFTIMGVALAALILAVLGVARDSAEADDGVQEPPTGLTVGRDGPLSHPRLDRQLAALANSATRGPLPDRTAAAATEVGIVIQTRSGAGPVIDGLLDGLGAAHTRRSGDMIIATVPAAALNTLASNPAIAAIASQPTPIADAIDGQGVSTINADQWHAAGLTGAGVRVAVIDLGFEGYSSLLGSELPSSVHTASFGCGASVQNEEDHGTAVAEIVHEVAPDAELYLLCIGGTFNVLSRLDEAVSYAVANGVDVINHSVGWFNSGRGDGTGALAPIVSKARNSDILWVNSAGNHAQQHWMGTYNDPSSNDWHNFSGADETIQFVLPTGGSVSAFLRWDDWPISTNDFDLYLFRAPNFDTPVAGSENEQSPHGYFPVERFAYTNNGSQGTFHLKIRRWDAAANPSMDLFLSFNHQQPAMQHHIPARSITDPATSPLVTAVGAVCWSTDAIRPYSSRGPTIDGRISPDLAGPDGVSNKTAGNSSGCSGGFQGTSASSPHVAGAAALLRQAYPTITVAHLHGLLLDLTVDAGAAGPDNDYGAGILALGSPFDHLGSISGTVTSAEVGVPIAGILVQARNSSNQVVSSTTTASNGTYTLWATPGTYRVRFSSTTAGYATQWWDANTSFGSADQIALSAGLQVPGVNAILSPAPTVGLVDPTQGQWHLRNSSGAVTSFYFGNPGDYPIMGDWNCNGIDTPGMYRQSDGFVYLRNSNTQGIANIRFFFGNPGDIPIVGDFNNNGCDTVSIYRPSNQTFYIINALGQNDGGLGAAAFSYVFGNPGDKPFVGDFNGNGQDTIGLHREATGFVYYRNTHTQGNASNQFFFGDPNDRFITGDWNANGTDSPGIFRPGNTTFYFRFTNTQGNADNQFVWGQSGWLPVSGNLGLG